MTNFAPERIRVPLERFLERLRSIGIRPLAALVPAGVTPNVLSFLRLALVIPLSAFLWQGAILPAFLVYGVAAVTDALDGELARLRGQISRFGSRLDPSVDKVLHGVLFLSFLSAEPFLLGLSLILDVLLFLIGLLLVVGVRRSLEMSASVYGRWKMVLQSLALLLLLVNAFVGSALVPRVFIRSVLVLALLFAVWSMVGYLRRVVRTHVAV